jgi:hypothetical protein
MLFSCWLDAWVLTRFPPLHQNVITVSELLKAAKQWLCGNYTYLLNNGTINAWLQEYPDIATNLHAQNLPRAKNGEIFAMATHLQVTGHGARMHAWAITSRALLWQTYVKLECACTSVWISRSPLRQTMLFPAASIWCSIVHLNGNISAPRAR